MHNTSYLIFLGLGSNVGDKKKHLDLAIDVLAKDITDIKVAPFYQTAPWGYTNQDIFLNTALSGYTILTPLALLDFVKDVEAKVGRIERFRWGPREIDIDILFYDNLIYQDAKLTIPHPMLHERDFVLRPLNDIASDMLHPLLKKTVKELYENLQKK